MQNLRGPFLEAGIWLLLAGLAYAGTFQFDERLPVYRFGAAAWPRMIILLLGLFAIVQLLPSLSLHRKADPARPLKAGDERGLHLFSSPGRMGLKRISTFLIPLLYVFFLPRVGYYVATPFFLSGYMYLLGERRPLLLFGTTLLIYIFVLLVFTKLFFVPLPVGNWPGFYEVNHFLLSLVK